MTQIVTLWSRNEYLLDTGITSLGILEVCVVSTDFVDILLYLRSFIF